jgi:hypothetical protein
LGCGKTVPPLDSIVRERLIPDSVIGWNRLPEDKTTGSRSSVSSSKESSLSCSYICSSSNMGGGEDEGSGGGTAVGGGDTLD